MNYYEHHIGDYAEATAHLSFVEDAAYSRLIRKYYAQEKCLPPELKAVQRLIGARTKEEKEAVQTVLEEFFVLESDGWHQARCDEEIARYQDKQLKAKASANARWNKNKTDSDGNANASTDAMRTHSDGNAHQTPDTRHQSPDLKPTTGSSTHDSTIVDVGNSADVCHSVAEISKTMRKYGINSNPAHPVMLELAKQGVLPTTLIAACERAKKAKPDENIPPTFVIGIIRNWKADAEKVNVAGAKPPSQHVDQGDLDRQNAEAHALLFGEGAPHG